MASSSRSSTSSTRREFTYDLFISFRGFDVRKNFVDHLYLALQRKNIHFYKEDEETKKGKGIHDQLVNAIEDSKFYIVIFTKNYVSSSWCKHELLKIMECQRTRREHVVYPVFLNVEPSEVRKQTGAVKEAFASDKNEACAAKLREALSEAANVVGWDLNAFNGHEAILIQNMVEQIALDLCNLNIEGKLVPMETAKKDALVYIRSGIDDIMTATKEIATSTKVALGKISSQFEGNSLVRNIARLVQKANTESYQHGVIELTQIRQEKKQDSVRVENV